MSQELQFTLVWLTSQPACALVHLCGTVLEPPLPALGPWFDLPPYIHTLQLCIKRTLALATSAAPTDSTVVHYLFNIDFQFTLGTFDFCYRLFNLQSFYKLHTCMHVYRHVSCVLYDMRVNISDSGWDARTCICLGKILKVGEVSGNLLLLKPQYLVNLLLLLLTL